MNADRLLDAFNRLGDEPDTVQQFRKLVVGLAMSGKLVTPDEAALAPSDLLKQIEAKKRALVQQGVLRKQNPLSAVSLEDLPKGFTNASSFVRLGEIARIEKGQTGIMKAEPGAYPLVVTAEERGTCDHFDFDGSAAIVPLVSSAGHGKASLQRLHYQEGKFALGSILAAIFPHAPELISARFLFEYLTSFKDELLVSQMIGTANVSLSVGKVSDVPVPLVPPFVQRKVDELMGLCDRLEAAQGAREAVRDRLAAASLARLNAPDTKASPAKVGTGFASGDASENESTFQSDARFALDALSALTTRPDQIKRLRQTILNLAVRGKLVPQNANDEPASELLKRIAADKADRAISARDRRATKIRPLAGDEVPFPVPANWLWAAFGDITISRDGERIPVSREEREQRAKVYDYYGASGVIDKIDGFLFDKPLLLIGEDGANLINRSTPIAFIARGKYWVNNHAHVLDGLSEGFLRYVELFMNAIDLKPYVTGTAQPKMNQAKMNSIPVALPPLAEQHRIVAKVDALMALCDRLEASLTKTAATRRRLLDALLTEALAPVDVRELEAAE